MFRKYIQKFVCFGHKLSCGKHFKALNQDCGMFYLIEHDVLVYLNNSQKQYELAEAAQENAKKAFEQRKIDKISASDCCFCWI